MSFRRTRRVSLARTDAAGVLFFAEQLVLVHEVYEELLAEGGLPLARVFKEGAFGLPILRAETELSAPLYVDDEVEICLSVSRLGETSFTLEHVVTKGGAAAGEGRTVHVCVDAAAARPRPLPEELRALLSAYL